MNITISVEELQSYQRSCEDWVDSTLQKEKFEHMLKTSDCGHDVRSWLRSEIDKIDSYLKEHPMPKLIPNA